MAFHEPGARQTTAEQHSPTREEMETLLREAIPLLKNMNGHACLCTGCVEDAQAAYKLVARIEKRITPKH